MKKSYFKIVKIVICMCTCSTMLLSISKPEITLSQYVVSPRINLFTDPAYEYNQVPGLDENILYRTQIDFRYQFSERVHISCISEYGSPNFRYDQDFRLQSLIVDFKQENYNVSVGRQTLRNPFYYTSIDGIKVETPNGQGNQFSISAGIIPEFFNNPGTQKKIIQASGKFAYDQGVTTLSVWDIKDDSENSYTAGLINRHRISDQLNFTTYLSWNLKENLPYYNKLHIRYGKGKQSMYLGFRQRVFNIEDLYPWIPDENWVIKSMYVGGYHNLSHDLMFKLHYSIRYADRQGSQFQTSFQYKKYNLTILSGDIDGDKLTGGMFSAQYDLNSAISFGGNFSLNSVDEIDETELKESTSIYGWSEMKIGHSLKVRIFGQYSENSYYTQDGRGGIFLSYVF